MAFAFNEKESETSFPSIFERYYSIVFFECIKWINHLLLKKRAKHRPNQVVWSILNYHIKCDHDHCCQTRMNEYGNNSSITMDIDNIRNWIEI